MAAAKKPKQPSINERLFAAADASAGNLREENARLREEVARLRALLAKHGIEAESSVELNDHAEPLAAEAPKRTKVLKVKPSTAPQLQWDHSHSDGPIARIGGEGYYWIDDTIEERFDLVFCRDEAGSDQVAIGIYDSMSGAKVAAHRDYEHRLA